MTRTPLPHIAAALLVCALLLPCCDKLPMNGKLDGMWQLMSIETPGAVRQTRDSLVFISIQLQLVQWNDRIHRTQLYSHFSHTGDSLIFFDIAHTSLHSQQSNNNEWLTPEELTGGVMDAWGIHTTDTRYRILTLESSTLVLEKADTVLRLRKF